MRALNTFLSIIAAFLWSSTAALADDGPLQLSFSQLAPNGAYTVTIERVVAIFTADPGIQGSERLSDTTVKGKNVWIVKTLPSGSRLYAIGLGHDWAGKGNDIRNIDLEKAKSSALISGGTARLDFVRPEGQQCRVLNLVIVFPDGTRAWGPAPALGDSFRLNVGGKPALGWCFDGQRIEAMAAQQRAQLAK